MIVRVKGQSNADSVKQRIRAALAGDPDVARFGDIGNRLAFGVVRLEASQYDARELLRFKDQVWDRAFESGAHSLDLDERDGVIRIGVADEATRALVSAEVIESGAPPDAVVIDIRRRAVPALDLKHFMRPVPGGVQIWGGGVPPCTLGVNVFLATSEQWGFLTAAHCTAVYGQASGEPMYQNISGGGNLIGHELLDPPLWAPGFGSCPASSSGCRYTDVALFTYASDLIPDGHTIAHPTGYYSTTVSPTLPRFYVTGASLAFPYEGMEVHKVGRTTGWTKSEVTATCVYIELSSIGRFCSYAADLDGDLGDSGAPIFVGAEWPTFVDVEFAGILFAINLNSAQTWYSPYIYIQLEIEGEIADQLVYGCC